jgi:hypothetical protein
VAGGLKFSIASARPEPGWYIQTPLGSRLWRRTWPEAIVLLDGLLVAYRLQGRL